MENGRIKRAERNLAIYEIELTEYDATKSSS